MSSFDGRLRLPGQAKLPLAVEVDISQERMRLIAGEETVADWPLEGLEVIAESDGFHITVDDEKAVLSVTESTRFAKELGLNPQPPKKVAAKTAPRGAHTDPPAAADVDHFAEVRGRIDEIATALTTDSIPPAEAFARWHGLLKEINLAHGQGSMPTDVFYEFNTRLLDLIPAATATDL